MNIKVYAPLIGEGVEELNLVAWKKKPGDPVQEGEGLVELESDKVTTEVPSPATGRIVELLAQAGDTVRAGEAIALIDGASVEAQAAPVAQAEAAAAGAMGPGPIPIAPGALRPHSLIRRRIAQRMIDSQRSSAHVLTVAEADMGAVVAHLEASKAGFRGEGIKLSLSAYFVHALARALRRFPEMNSSWAEEGSILYPDVNVGIAVSLGDEGLIVPVLKRADTLGLAEIARGIARLAAEAREGRLAAEDVQGATFTLTNYGATGSLLAAPIIDQPQVGILGTGSVQKRPVVVADSSGADSIAIRPMVYLSLVFDHRAMDGEAAGSFLRSVKEGLEAWGRVGT
jgi:2-oxoglutarate dehydrogenase E2 component (dihydrolipoamide succinyltransferase)